MNASTRTSHFGRPSALGRLVIAALLGTSFASALMLTRMYTMAGEVAPPVIAFAVVPALASIAACLRQRWAPLPGAITAALIALMLAPHLPDTVRVPADVLFTPFILLRGFAIAGDAIGMVAVVRNYRRAPGHGRILRWVLVTPGAGLGLVAGFLLMGSMPTQGAATAIDPEMLARLPVVEAGSFEFDQREIHVRAGTPMAIRLDGTSHSLDIDEFDVHVLMPPEATTLAAFTAPEPGSYTFYCAPHYDKHTGRGMKGTLVVEP